ncbi:sulfatase-like hydrolase/transferase, partial [Proteus mirabilis]
SENKFIVIHLLGSHLPYTNYYYNDKRNNPDMDDYDLTILKTDNIISRIQSIVENSGDYVLIYTSDHGEIVNKGHGFRYGKDQFLIPLFLFTNQDQKLCKYINKFRGNNGWLNGNMNKYILSEFLGYNIDEKHLDKEKEQDKILNANSEIMLFEQID